MKKCDQCGMYQPKNWDSIVCRYCTYPKVYDTQKADRYLPMRTDQ